MSGHKGLYDKYEIKRKATGELCPGFVLRPETDRAAVWAILEYARVTHNPRLSKDIREWIKEFI